MTKGKTSFHATTKGVRSKEVFWSPTTNVLIANNNNDSTETKTTNKDSTQTTNFGGAV